MEEVNFYNNFIMLGEYLKTIEHKNKNEFTRALCEIYFYANSLRINNREMQSNLSKWQDKYYEQINNNNGKRIHIS